MSKSVSFGQLCQFVKEGNELKIAEIVQGGLLFEDFLYTDDQYSILDYANNRKKYSLAHMEIFKLLKNERNRLIKKELIPTLQQILGCFDQNKVSYKVQQALDTLRISMVSYNEAYSAVTDDKQLLELRVKMLEKEVNDQSPKAYTTSASELEDLFNFAAIYQNDEKNLSLTEEKSALVKEDAKSPLLFAAPEITQPAQGADPYKLWADVAEINLKGVQNALKNGLYMSHFAGSDSEEVSLLDLAALSVSAARSEPQKNKVFDSVKILNLLQEAKRKAIFKEILPVLQTAVMSLEKENDDERYQMRSSTRQKLNDFLKIYRAGHLISPHVPSSIVLQKVVNHMKKEAQNAIEAKDMMFPYTLSKLYDFTKTYAPEARQVLKINQNVVAHKMPSDQKQPETYSFSAMPTTIVRQKGEVFYVNFSQKTQHENS